MVESWLFNNTKSGYVNDIPPFSILSTLFSISKTNLWPASLLYESEDAGLWYLSNHVIPLPTFADQEESDQARRTAAGDESWLP